MKKIMLITYYFPPYQDIGSQRPFGLAKYLPQFGLEPIVVTPKLSKKPPEGIRVINTDYNDVIGSFKSKFGFKPEKGLHEQLGITVSKNFNSDTWKSKTIKLLREIISFPDEERGWYKFALKSASKFLDRERVDVIISTSSPVTSHLIAKRLRHKYKIPWIADLRDLWTQNPYSNKFGLIKYFERRLELKTLSDADALVTVTSPWIDTFGLLHKNKNIFCVTNGFDDDDFRKLPSRLTSKFTLTYTGTLYNGKRDPSLLFEVVEQLISENKINSDLIEIRFFSRKEDWLIDDIKKYNLEGVVNFYGYVPREEALERQIESQILLLLLWDNKNEESFCPGKIYEYFGARRPIVAIGRSRGVVKKLLEETNSGKCTNDIAELKKYLYKYYQEFIKHGEVSFCGNKNIEKYSYRAIAEKYSKLLNDILI